MSGADRLWKVKYIPYNLLLRYQQHRDILWFDLGTHYNPNPVAFYEVLEKHVDACLGNIQLGQLKEQFIKI